MRTIRTETPADIPAIDSLLRECFEGAEEAELVAALRDLGDLSLSLVAEADGTVIGHIAFSPLLIESHPAAKYHALAPLAVSPDYRRRGGGADLSQSGLARLKESGAHGAIVLGNPVYYGRFGFRAEFAHALVCPWSGPNLQALHFQNPPPALSGSLTYARAFGA